MAWCLIPTYQWGVGRRLAARGDVGGWRRGNAGIALAFLVPYNAYRGSGLYAMGEDRPMVQLSLCFLGPLRAMLAGDPVDGLGSVKARALLAYLAVEEARPCTREALAGLLWADWPQRAARSNLRHDLAVLRRSIGDHAANPPFLLISRETIQFNVDSDHYLDVDAFMRLTSSNQAAATAVDPLEQAMAVHQGRFLEGFSLDDSPAFEEWVLLKREEIAQRAVMALHRLAAHYENAVDYAKAGSFARQSVQLNPWDEEGHRRLMRALALDGQRGMALAQYGSCSQLLDEGLGVKPAQATTELYERIRDGTLGEVTDRRPPLPRLMPRSVDRPPTPAAVEESLFVGRETELGRLDRALDAALDGRGRAVFVVGEPGSGKTALVHAFCRRSMDRHRELAVAVGKCNAMVGVGDPYLPFIEILAMLAGDVESRQLGRSISPDHARRLWALLPHTAEALLERGQDLLDHLVSSDALLGRMQACVPDDSAALAQLRAVTASGTGQPTEVQQAHLFVQCTQVLQSLACRGPLVLVLDDLQWADSGSIGLLFHLGRRLEGYSILIIGIYRPQDVALGRDGERHPLEPVIREFGRLFGESHTDLDKADGRAFLGALLDSEANRLEEDFRQRLYQSVGGHPLFALELLSALQEKGHLLQDKSGSWIAGPDLDWGQLPPRVEAVIGERFERLPAELQGTLAVASVEGETFTAQVVACVQGAHDRDVIGQLGGPLSKAHRLVVPQSLASMGGKPIHRYRFQHHLVYRYVYDRLDPMERAYLHGAVGDALRQVHGNRAEATVHVASQLGWHYSEAGRKAEASEHYYVAGREAVRVGASQEALRHFEQALVCAGADDLRYRILAERSKLLLALYRGAEAIADLEALLEHSRESGDLTGGFDAALGLIEGHFWRFTDGEARDVRDSCQRYYELARGLAERLGDAVSLCRALHSSMWYTISTVEHGAGATEDLRHALALSQDIGDEDLVIQCTTELLGLEDPPERERLAEDLKARLKRRRDLVGLQRLYFHLAFAHLDQGHFAESIAYSQEGRLLAEELDAPWIGRTAWFEALLAQGRFDAAWDAVHLVAEDTENTAYGAAQSYCVGLFYYALMAYEKAAESFRKAADWWQERFPRQWNGVFPRWLLARTSIALARIDQEQLTDVCEDLTIMRRESLVDIALAGAAFAENRPVDALEASSRAATEALVENLNLRPHAAEAMELHVRALLELGRNGEALRLADKAIALCEEMEYKLLLWRLRAGRARALEMLGRRDEAEREYRASAAIIRGLAGALPDEDLKQGFLSHPSVASVLAAADARPLP